MDKALGQETLRISALLVRQPIGEFYVGVISHRDLIQISFADMRRLETELDRYVGIQRKLLPDRVAEIGKFVKSIDATFPTSIVLAVPRSCVEYDEATKQLVFSEGIDEETGKQIRTFEIAHILDGQHRIEGLKAFTDGDFELPVSIFVEADIADQAYVFATVNLAQTKVNRSLVYDLLDFAKGRSPQKSCHDISVALDKFETSPFRNLIKRLGSATPGRTGETLTQATVVNSLLPFLSEDPVDDRERMARGKSIKSNPEDYSRMPFRWIWLANRDADIARILMEYFGAVAEKWPGAWQSRERGNILPRTNGFKAFMRFLKVLYLHENREEPREDPVISRQRVKQILDLVDLKDRDFTSDRFPPGSSGEKQLYETIREMTKI